MFMLFVLCKLSNAVMWKLASVFLDRMIWSFGKRRVTRDSTLKGTSCDDLPERVRCFPNPPEMSAVGTKNFSLQDRHPWRVRGDVWWSELVLRFQIQISHSQPFFLIEPASAIKASTWNRSVPLTSFGRAALWAIKVFWLRKRFFGHKMFWFFSFIYFIKLNQNMFVSMSCLLGREKGEE